MPTIAVIIMRSSLAFKFYVGQVLSPDNTSGIKLRDSRKHTERAVTYAEQRNLVVQSDQLVHQSITREHPLDLLTTTDRCSECIDCTPTRRAANRRTPSRKSDRDESATHNSFGVDIFSAIKRAAAI